jgi:hypothetical protein
MTGLTTGEDTLQAIDFIEILGATDPNLKLLMGLGNG